MRSESHHESAMRATMGQTWTYTVQVEGVRGSRSASCRGEGDLNVRIARERIDATRGEKILSRAGTAEDLQEDRDRRRFE